MNLENIGKDCPCYEFDCSDIMFDIGEFCGLPPNNGKLTIQVNGETVGDFSANQQEDETINITTPTSQDIADAVAGEALLRERADRDIQAVLDGESLARVNADRDLQSQIDAIASKSDVVDVVGTYAELQAYDTSKLNDNDVVKVLDDSTHNDTMTYYRWNKTTQTWSYIGQESPYYSKSQMDTLLATKQDNLTAGNGIDITGDTISVDTTVLATKSDLESYAEKSNTYTKSEVDNLVEPKLSVDVVESLPAVGEESKLYLTAKAHTTQTATGNPISATITDGAGKIKDFQLDGDTFQQSYEGKNLYNFVSSGTDQGLTATYDTTTWIIAVTGTANTNYSNISLPVDISLTVGESYTSSIDRELPVRAVTRVTYTDNTASVFNIEPGQTSVTWSPVKQVRDIRLYLSLFNPGDSYDLSFRFQLEAGSTPDYDFEPYVGGTPSPNPYYPQPIQVVTGEQTVSINGTDYPISLGSIELCKLGTYQDYIYKDGDTWKVHKATKKITLNGTEEWLKDSTGGLTRFNIQIQETIFVSGRTAMGISSHFVPSIVNAVGIFFLASTGIARRFYFYPETNITTVDGFKSWLEANNTILLYPLATATDTEITDATLISQLNAIASASLENGSNTITNTATGSNLAGDMEVDYFGYDPTNRYDKWLWLDINNAYEKLGS